MIYYIKRDAYKEEEKKMKRIFAWILCFALLASLFAGCKKAEQNPSALQTFSQMLTSSDYTFVTTTGPDGTTTVELVPPTQTTQPTTQSQSTTDTQQPTTRPSASATTLPSVQPTTQSSGMVTTVPTTNNTTQDNTTVSTTGATTVPTGTTGNKTTANSTTGTTVMPTTGTSTSVTTTPITGTTTGKPTDTTTPTTSTTAVTTSSVTEATTAKPTTQPTTAITTVTTVLSTTRPTTLPTTGHITVQPTATVTVPTVTTEPEVLKLKKTSLLLTSLGATYNLSDGTIAPNKILWISQNERVAMVDNGIVTAVSMGTTKIYAHYNDQTVSCTVTVQLPTTEPPAVLKLTHTSLLLLVGKTQTVYNGPIPAADIQWLSTNPVVASVSNGKVTAHRPGSTTIKATYQGQSASCTVTVQQPTTDPTTWPPTTDPTTLPPTTQVTTINPAAHTKLSYTKRYMYTQLSSQEKGWYRSIDEAVNNLQNDVTLMGDFSDPEWYKIYFVYMYDNPEHFYLGARVAYSSNGKLMFSYSDGTSNSYHEGSKKGDLDRLTETMRTNIRARKATFDAEVRRIISAVPVDISDAQKELMLYDRLLIDMHYNTGAVWDKMADPNWTAYGGIINKYGVCEAYAEAFQTLCYAVGINCTGVNGIASGGGHKWNAVQLDGEWYQCDLTFDDPLGGQHGVAQFHEYFNITSSQMMKDHSIADSDYPGPNCTATKYKYWK